MKNPLKIVSLAIVIVALCFVQSAVAQISQGTKSIGGSVSLSFGDVVDRIIVVPDFSYFISENLALGGRVGLAYVEIENPSVNPVVNGYIRKYKFINEKFAFYGEGFVQYSPSNYYGPYNYSELAIGVIPGFTYFLDEKFAIDLNFGGFVVSTDFNNDTNVNLFLSPASLYNFGLKYFIR